MNYFQPGGSAGHRSKGHQVKLIANTLPHLKGAPEGQNELLHSSLHFNLFTVNMNCLDTRRVDSIKCITLLCLCVRVRVRCVWCVSARFRTRSYSHLSLLLAVMPSKRTDPSAVYVKRTTPNLPTYDAFAQPFPTVCQRSVALQQ